MDRACVVKGFRCLSADISTEFIVQKCVFFACQATLKIWRGRELTGTAQAFDTSNIVRSLAFDSGYASSTAINAGRPPAVASSIGQAARDRGGAAGCMPAVAASTYGALLSSCLWLHFLLTIG